MRNTMYMEESYEDLKPYQKVCEKLSKRNLQKTFHDLKDPDGGRVINLNSYLGIDSRGTRKFSPLRVKISQSNFCRNKRVNCKSVEKGDMNRSHMSFMPSSRATIFGKPSDTIDIMESNRFEKK